MSAESRRLEGTIEYHDQEWVRGFALDPETPDRPLRIQVFEGDVLLAEVVPSIYRWDLRSRGMGNGNQGFLFEIPARSENSLSRTLHFRFEETGGELEGSPVEVSEDSGREAQPLQGQLANPPLVSIIVRTKDRKMLLRDALSSVLTQTYPNLEVVLVNDGGEDVSDVAAEFARSVPVRHIELEESQGMAGAANRGTESASGKYVLFLDDDDVLYPSHVAKLAGFLEATGGRVAYSDCERARYGWSEGGAVELGEKELFMGVEHDPDRLHYSNYIPFMTAMMDRGLHGEVGGFDESLEVYEDWDFWIRASHVADFSHLPGITALYRVFNEREYNKFDSEIYRKHRDYWSIENLAKSAWPRIDLLKAEADALKVRNLGLDRQVRDLGRSLADRQGDVTALEQALKDSERHYGASQAALAEAKRWAGELERASRELEAEAEKGARWAMELETQNIELHERLQRLEEVGRQLEETRSALARITDSLPWRIARWISAPVRSLFQDSSG